MYVTFIPGHPTTTCKLLPVKDLHFLGCKKLICHLRIFIHPCKSYISQLQPGAPSERDHSNSLWNLRKYYIHSRWCDSPITHSSCRLHSYPTPSKPQATTLLLNVMNILGAINGHISFFAFLPLHPANGREASTTRRRVSSLPRVDILNELLWPSIMVTLYLVSVGYKSLALFSKHFRIQSYYSTHPSIMTRF